MTRRALDNLNTQGTLVAEEINRDPSFRAEWERTAPAREVAAQLIAYRADSNLTQRELAGKLGVSQPRVAKLEMGEHNPEINTLITLSEKLGIEFVIDVVPAGRQPRLVTKRVKDTRVAGAESRVSVLVAAG